MRESCDKSVSAWSDGVVVVGRPEEEEQRPEENVEENFHQQEILEYDYSKEDASAQAAKARIRAYNIKKKKASARKRQIELETRWYRQRQEKKAPRNPQAAAVRRARAFVEKQERKERRRRRAEAKNKWYLKTGDPPVLNGREIAARSASAWTRAQKAKRAQEAREKREQEARIAREQARIQRIADRTFRKKSNKIEDEARRRFNGECARSRGFAPGPYRNDGHCAKNEKTFRTFGKFITNAVAPEDEIIY